MCVTTKAKELDWITSLNIDPSSSLPMVTSERVTKIKKHHHSSWSPTAKNGQCLSLIWLFHNSVLFIALPVLPPKPLDLTKKRPGKCYYSQCYTCNFWFPDIFSTWASFRLCSGTLGPSLYSGSCYWFRSKREPGKREHWPGEEQQIIVPIHQNLLLKHPLCPSDIRSKDLSNPMTTEDQVEQPGLVEGVPCPWQGVGTIWSLKLLPAQTIL